MRILQLISLILLTGLTFAPARAQPVSDMEKFAQFIHLRNFYERVCHDGYMPGCVTLAELHTTRINVPQDHRWARILYQRACAAGLPKGCDGFGQSLMSDKGGPADRERGLQLLQQACTDGAGDACLRLGFMARRENRQDESDQLHLQACAFGSATACNMIGADEPACEYSTWFTGLTHWSCERAARARIQQENAVSPRTIALLERGCSIGGRSSCAMLSGLYQIGEGVPRDLNQALFLLQRACRDGGESYCLDVARIDLEDPDAPRDTDGFTEEHRQRMLAMHHIARERCEKSDECGLSAQYLHYGIGAEVDLNAAMILYERACTGYDMHSCAAFADMLLESAPQDGRLSGTLARLGQVCLEGDIESCELLAPLREKQMQLPH